MMYILHAKCERCGTPLRVSLTGVDPSTDGDLYIEVEAGVIKGTALCKNATICAENQARNADSA